MKNKFWVLLLCIILVCISLTGCGKDKNANVIDKNTIYKETPIDVALEDGLDISQMICKGDRLYFSGYKTDEVTYEYKQYLGSFKVDGSDYKSFNLPESIKWIDFMEPLNNGNIVITYSDYFEDYSDPDNYIWQSFYYLVMLSPEGKEIKRISLSDEYEIDYINVIVVLQDGNILINGGDTSLLLDENFNCIKSKKDEALYNYGSYYTLKDGRVVTSSWGDMDLEFYYYDVNKMEKGEKLDLKVSPTTYSFQQGSGDFDFILRNNEGMFGYNVGDEDVTPILNFVNSDLMNSYFNVFTKVAEDTYIGTYSDWYGEERHYSVNKYTKVDPADVKDKKVLTLGVIYSDYNIRKNVIDFNKTNDEYRISITDYSKYDSEDDWSGGTKKFNADIASGNGPDIIVANGSTIHDYYSKGLFKDLTSYIKNDPDINYDDIFPNLIEACSYNGKLYELVPFFMVQTVVGKTSVVGDRTSWTFDEFMNFKNSLPEGTKLFNYMPRANFLYSILSVDSEEFVDMAKAQCHFDSPEFIRLLELAKDLPESDEAYWDDYDYYKEEAAYREGTTALYQTSLGSFYDYKSIRYATFGEDISFVGLPCREGIGSAIYYYSSYAISSKCKHPDVAWEIIRPYMLDEYQDTIDYGIPALMSKYDALGEKAKEKSYYIDENGEKVEYEDTYYVGGVEVALEPLTDSEVKKIKDFVLSVSKTQIYMEDLLTIINEEAEAFYEGQKSAEDVAKIIQSRASIFINEKQ